MTTKIHVSLNSIDFLIANEDVTKELLQIPNSINYENTDEDNNINDEDVLHRSNKFNTSRSSFLPSSGYSSGSSPLQRKRSKGAKFKSVTIENHDDETKDQSSYQKYPKTDRMEINSKPKIPRLDFKNQLSISKKILLSIFITIHKIFIE